MTLSASFNPLFHSSYFDYTNFVFFFVGVSVSFLGSFTMYTYSTLAQLLLLLLVLADFSKTALRFTEASFGSTSFCALCCPFSLASYENLQRAFSETSIQSFYALPFSALIQVKRVSPVRSFPTYPPFLLVAKIFIVLRSYRLRSLFAIEIHAAAFFGFSTLTAAPPSSSVFL